MKEHHTPRFSAHQAAEKLGYNLDVLQAFQGELYVGHGLNRRIEQLTPAQMQSVQRSYRALLEGIDHQYAGNVRVEGALRVSGKPRLCVTHIPTGVCVLRRRTHLLEGQEFWLNHQKCLEAQHRQEIAAMTDMEVAQYFGYDLGAMREAGYSQPYVGFGNRRYIRNLDEGTESARKRFECLEGAIANHLPEATPEVIGAGFPDEPSNRGVDNRITHDTSHYYLVVRLRDARGNAKWVALRDDHTDNDIRETLGLAAERKRRPDRTHRRIDDEDLLSVFRATAFKKSDEARKISDIRRSNPPHNSHGQALVDLYHEECGWILRKVWFNIKNGHLPTKEIDDYRDRETIIASTKGTSLTLLSGPIRPNDRMRQRAKYFGIQKSLPTSYHKFDCTAGHHIRPPSKHVKQRAKKGLPILCTECFHPAGIHTLGKAIRGKVQTQKYFLYIAQECDARNKDNTPWINIGITTLGYASRYPRNHHICVQHLTELAFTEEQAIFALILEQTIHSTFQSVDYATKTKDAGRTNECYSLSVGFEAVQAIIEALEAPLSLLPRLRGSITAEELSLLERHLREAASDTSLLNRNAQQVEDLRLMLSRISSQSGERPSDPRAP